MHSKGCFDYSPLSLSLIFDDLDELPEGFHLYVEYEMAILSQLGVGLEKVTCE